MNTSKEVICFMGYDLEVTRSRIGTFVSVAGLLNAMDLDGEAHCDRLFKNKDSMEFWSIRQAPGVMLINMDDVAMYLLDLPMKDIKQWGKRERAQNLARSVYCWQILHSAFVFSQRAGEAA